MENQNNEPLNNNADNIEVIPKDYYGGVRQFTPGARPLAVSGNAPAVAPVTSAGVAPINNTSTQTVVSKKINWQSPKVIIGAMAVVLLVAVSGATVYYVRQAQEVKNRLASQAAPVVAEEPVSTVPEAPVVPEIAPTSTVAQTPTRPPTSAIVAPARNYGKTADLDNDELTDVEEAIYKTDAQKPDTDIDGFADGLEVVSLFNPIGYKPVRLMDSGVVKLYVNPTYQYSIFYPAVWLEQSLDVNNQEVMFTADTGEFVEITVEDNPLKQSVADWYASKAPEVSAADLKPVTTKEGLAGIYSPDSLVAYLPWEDKIYVINYNIGLRDTVNFSQTFKMMVNSMVVGIIPTMYEGAFATSTASFATTTAP